jgi:hypothetical protein
MLKNIITFFVVLSKLLKNFLNKTIYFSKTIPTLLLIAIFLLVFFKFFQIFVIDFFFIQEVEIPKEIYIPKKIIKFTRISNVFNYNLFFNELFIDKWAFCLSVIFNQIINYIFFYDAFKRFCFNYLHNQNLDPYKKIVWISEIKTFENIFFFNDKYMLLYFFILKAPHWFISFNNELIIFWIFSICICVFIYLLDAFCFLIIDKIKRSKVLKKFFSKKEFVFEYNPVFVKKYEHGLFAFFIFILLLLITFFLYFFNLLAISDVNNSPGNLEYKYRLLKRFYY